MPRRILNTPKMLGPRRGVFSSRGGEGCCIGGDYSTTIHLRCFDNLEVLPLNPYPKMMQGLFWVYLGVSVRGGGRFGFVLDVWAFLRFRMATHEILLPHEL